jgi:hypothetical protein
MTDTTPKSRWYRLTPDRLVLFLLAVEGLLWLSERLEWFPFSRYHGWAVLIAMASVGFFLLVIFGWFVLALLFRWRFQFSIRSLLVLTVAVAAACSWLATQMKEARKQREALEEIEKARGTTPLYSQLDPSGYWTSGAPPEPPWLRRLLGDDLFLNVTRVTLPDRAGGDAGLEWLKALTNLQKLWLSDTTISDAGLQHLKGLTKLQELWLGRTNVGDAGLQHLEGLTQLENLQLYFTRISDAGLEHLKVLTRLKILNLYGNKVTDAGLQHLKGLTQLKFLGLGSTKVTHAGVKRLQQELPMCRIVH